ncbi:hypothetical protein N0O01_005737, partial [Klebsiella variicola]
MAFNPELGSTSPAVLLDNAERLDKLVNGSALTEPDRAGDDLDTWRGMMAKNEALTEETRQNLIPLSRQYATLAAAQADIANIPVNSTTYVRSQDGSALADEYINNAGTLVATGRKMPSLDAVNDVYASLSPAIQLINTGEINDVSRLVASLNQIAAVIRGLYTLSSQTIAATGNTSLSFSDTGAIFFDSISTTSTTAILNVAVSDSSGTVFSFGILPREAISGGVLSTPFKNRIFTANEVTDYTQEASVVRVRMLLALDSQYTSSGEYNIFDKSGVFAPVSQALASAQTTLSVSTHSAGGIQLMIPTSDITGAGYTVSLESIKDFIRDKYGAISLWYRTSTTRTRRVVDFCITGTGNAGVVVDAGVTVSASAYSAARSADMEGYATEAALNIEVLHRKYREYGNKFASKKITDAALDIPDESVIELINVNTSENNNAGYYTLSFNDQNGVKQGVMFWPAALTNLDGGSFYSPYGLFAFPALEFVSASL